MDEDGDGPVLVIDLDDEREEKQNDDEIQPANYKADNQHKEDKTVRTLDRGVTISNETNDDDDDILVIDDDNDDYEYSVQKLIQVANKVGKEYRKSNPVEAEGQNLRLSANQEPKRTNQDNGRQLLYPDTCHKERNQVTSDIIRDRIMHHVIERATERKACTTGICNRRCAVNEAPYLVDKNTPKSRENVAYRLETAPDVERRNHYKPDALTIDEYHAAIKMFEYNRNHRPEVIINNNNCREAAVNRNVYDHTYRAEDVLSMDKYRRALYRDPHTPSHFYRPEALNIRDYKNVSAYRDKNNHAFAPEVHLTNDRYSHDRYNRVLYDPLRPQLSNDGYRLPDMNKDCNYVNRPNETLVNDDYINRHAVMSRVPLTYGYASALDDYWQNILSRHAYTPEGVVDIDEYERAVINRHAYTGYGPLSIDPYRSEQTHLYRPDLVHIDAYRESMLRRGPYYPETVGVYNYEPHVSHNNGYRSDPKNAYTNGEAILNLSRKPEPTHVGINLSRDKAMNGNKLRNILSSGNYIPVNINKCIYNSENPDLHRDKHNAYTDRNFIENRETILNVRTPERYIRSSKQAVPARANQLDTVIWNTDSFYQNMIPNMPPRTDDSSQTKTISVAAKEARDNEALLIPTKRDNVHEEKIHKRTQTVARVADDAKKEKDNNVRFLVVFFSRVKELVKDTFPEFSKSLEREINNLGEVTNSGRLKTDIQYICPLYCSVSTYYLPRFDGVDDNKIEKHAHRTKICDVCSCIQNCYKLYKKKYFNLVSTANTGNEIKQGYKRKMDDDTISDTRTDRQSVICRHEGNNINENTAISENDSEHNKDTRKLIKLSGAEGNQTDQFGYAPRAANNVNENHQLLKLNEKTLLESLSILNFNPPASNKGKDSLHNNINYESVIEKAVVNCNEKISDPKSPGDNQNYPRDEAEANHILSLSYNEITNADIISSKLKNKSGRKPDAVFTCHVCSCIFTYFTSFVSHMQKEHDINGIDEDIPDECIARKCPFCGVYSKQKYYNDHVKRAHPQIFTHKGEPNEIQILKETKRKSTKRKFIFTCLVCHKNLKSREVKRHREKYHKGVHVAKMFTKKLSTLD